MTVIVTDTGFGPETWTTPIVPLEEARKGVGITLPSSADPLELAGRLPDVQMIKVHFPSFGSPRISGYPVPTGRPTTIKSGCAAEYRFYLT